MGRIIQMIKHGIRAGLYLLKKFAPELCVTTGVVTLAASPVTAVRRSYLKEEFEKDIPETDNKLVSFKNKVIVTAKTYWPTILMIIFGGFLVFFGNHLFRKQIAVVTASFTALSAKFDEYRRRNKELHGDDGNSIDAYCMGNGTVETLPDGSKVISTNDEIDDTYFSFTFDPSCHSPEVHWTCDKAYNISQLLDLEHHCNLLLQADRALLVNDIRRLVGLKPTAPGSEQGFYFDLKQPDQYQNAVYFKGIHKGEYDVRDSNPNIEFSIHTDGKVNHLL